MATKIETATPDEVREQLQREFQMARITIEPPPYTSIAAVVRIIVPAAMVHFVEARAAEICTAIFRLHRKYYLPVVEAAENVDDDKQEALL